MFGVPQAYSAPDVALASYAYAVQIFCDFSGYTDIAIGLALLMGFVFPQNFDRPYRAQTFREFWRRWHMTLSRFLRDFLYIPLGGNRGGKWKTARNLMITMVLGGLWHGAAWGFVLWGFIHGCSARDRERVPRADALLAARLGEVGDHVPHRRAGLDPLPRAGSEPRRRVRVAARRLGPRDAVVVCPSSSSIVLVIGLQLLPTKPMDALRVSYENLHPAALGASMAVVIVLVTATISSQGVPPFIYFQF